MCYFSSFLFCLLYVLMFLHKKLALASENASSISESKFKSNGNDEDPVYLITGGYRPEKHILAKYVVSIRRGYSDKCFGCFHWCGGSILNPELIMTAAHCLQKDGRNFHPSSLEVVAGASKRLAPTKWSQIVQVRKVLVHSEYNDRLVIYDIGLLQLESKLHLDDIHAQVIPLPTAPPVDGAMCVTLGWGRMFTDGPFANEILYGNIMLLPKGLCQQIIYYFHHKEICAVNPEDVGQSACHGDSGGPLICNGSVAGIVSFGYGCGVGYPVVYTDVYKFLDWIKKSKSGRQKAPHWLLVLFNLAWITIV